MIHWLAILAIGATVGFLAGLFGKGGSAMATPVLHTIGLPAMVALAAPLPATIPSTMVASAAWWREHQVDRRVLWWSVVWGLPATVAGALLTRWISGVRLVQGTDLLLAGLGVRFLLAPDGPGAMAGGRREPAPALLAGVSVVAGLAGGLLANSGGFLLAPLYIAVLGLTIKPALATSLAVAAVLAVPGTIVHAALGHVDWAVVAVFGTASIPLSWTGARVAVRARPERLQRAFGVVLALLGTGFLLIGR